MKKSITIINSNLAALKAAQELEWNTEVFSEHRLKQEVINNNFDDVNILKDCKVEFNKISNRVLAAKIKATHKDVINHIIKSSLDIKSSVDYIVLECNNKSREKVISCFYPLEMNGWNVTVYSCRATSWNIPQSRNMSFIVISRAGQKIPSFEKFEENKEVKLNDILDKYCRHKYFTYVQDFFYDPSKRPMGSIRIGFLNTEADTKKAGRSRRVYSPEGLSVSIDRFGSQTYDAVCSGNSTGLYKTEFGIRRLTEYEVAKLQGMEDLNFHGFTESLQTRMMCESSFYPALYYVLSQIDKML